MPQTMLAILAMVLTSFFAFNQHRSVLNTRMTMIAQEIELRSTAVAVDLIEEIGSLAFDEAVKDGPINASNLLTPILADLVQNTESAQADDIDDFNRQSRTVTRVVGASDLSFVGTSRVAYVESDGVTSSFVPTKYKKLTIVVRSNDFAMSDSVSISKVIACGSRCNW